MDNDRDRISEVFNATVALSQEQRQEFLDKCFPAGDAARIEVEKLLANHDRAADLIKQATLDFQANIKTIEAFASRIGPYKLLSELGRGGMGIVYLAERSDGAFQKQVAIKLMQRTLEPAEIARFRRERQILADLEHPNIARLLDGGISEDGRQYVVMEYANGSSLRSLLRERGALTVDMSIRIALQLCDAMAAAHAQGIIHRDIKPENIVVQEKGERVQIKVLDFGIAKMTSLSESSITRAGTIMGTPGYMSPEMAEAGADNSISPAADTYSTGLVLYEMLSGRRAFDGDSLLSILHKQVSQRPAPLSELSPAVPTVLEQIVEKAIDKDPQNRYSSAQELARDLENARQIPANKARASSVAMKNESIAQERRNKTLVAALSVLVLALVAVLSSRYGRDTLSSLGLLTSPTASPSSQGNTGLLMYRFLRVRGGERKFIPIDAVLAEGDRFLMQFQTPFSGSLYLLYLDSHDASIIWTNPNDDGSPQHLVANKWIASPRESGIALDERPGRQVFRAVYVPETNKWTLSSLLGSGVPLLGEEHKKYAKLEPISARQLERFLDGQGIELHFSETPAQDLFKIDIALDDLHEKILTHTIIRKQVAR